MRPPCDVLLAYERAGHCTLRNLLPAANVESLVPAIDAAYAAQQLQVHKQKLRVLLGEEVLEQAEKQARDERTLLAVLRKHMAALPAGSAPFLQGFNLWRASADIAALACSPAIAGTAAALLGAPRVRLYQDALFVKRPGDGPTHWHSDLAMAPLDTNSFVTCWLPLQTVPAEIDGGSALVFANGSHRDVALHYWHGDPSTAADCSGRGYSESVAERLEVGDSTWHHGWALHCAGANQRRQPRRALALSFFADGATRLGREARRAVHTEDAESYDAWIDEVKPGRAARHRLLPLVWSDGRAQRIELPTPTAAASAPARAQRATRRPRAPGGASKGAFGKARTR